MLNGIEPLLPGLLALLPVYARLQGLVLALPGFGEAMLPVRVKVAVAAALTPLFAPLAPAGPPLEPSPAGIAAGLLLGLALGMFVRLMAMAIDVAATALAQTAQMSQLMGISPDMPPHPIGHLLHLGGIAVLMALGLPAALCRLAADSFRLWPPGSLPAATDIAPHAGAVVAQSFTVAMVIAAPFTLGGLLFQLLSGILARVMPALPVTFIAAPAAILLALTVLTLVAPSLLSVWAGAVFDQAAGLIPAIAPGAAR